MPYYETVFLARQDVSAQQVTSLTEGFTNVIKENGGDVPKSEYWGLRSLAYRIKKNRKAHYVLLNIDAPTAAVQEMERGMRINENVIRYMTLKVDELEESPSIMMRNKAAREERSRRDDRHGGGDERGGGRRGERASGESTRESKAADKDKETEAKGRSAGAGSEETAKGDKS